MSEVSFDVAFSLLSANFETGKLYWKPRSIDLFSRPRTRNSWNAQYANKEAFTATSSGGYKRGILLGHSYMAHRVLWLLATGFWPVEYIDHINGNPCDNRLCNLREVSNAENSKNQARRSNNLSGVTGICWRKDSQKWKVKIRVPEGDKHLGYFHDFNDAVLARKSAEKQFGFHPNHGR